MRPSKMMEEVWRWKEEAAEETAGMTTEELIAYYAAAEQRLAEKTGGKPLNLRRRPAKSKQRRGGET
jgi:hypothetical protein